MERNKMLASGVDYDDGLKRFNGNVLLYDRFMHKFFDDVMMDDLERQLQKKDYITAEKVAHSIKGTAGNLSLGCFYKTIYEMDSLLKQTDNLEIQKITSLFLTAKEQYQNIKKVVEAEE